MIRDELCTAITLMHESLQEVHEFTSWISLSRNRKLSRMNQEPSSLFPHLSPTENYRLFLNLKQIWTFSWHKEIYQLTHHLPSTNINTVTFQRSNHIILTCPDLADENFNLHKFTWKQALGYDFLLCAVAEDYWVQKIPNNLLILIYISHKILWDLKAQVPQELRMNFEFYYCKSDEVRSIQMHKISLQLGT